MAKLVPIPVPIAGLNTMDKYLDLNSRFARELTNYVLVQGGLRIRPAVRRYIANQSTGETWNHIYENTGTVYGIGTSAPGNIYNISTNTNTGNIGGACQALATRVKHVTLDLVFGCRAPRLYAQPFAAWTITTGTVTATAIVCGCSHKGRLYVTDGSTIEYSGIGQVTGAMTGGTFAASDFLEGQSILRMFSVTVLPGNNTESIFVIFGSGGKVLIYGGNHPNDSTWHLIGSYDMPAPPTRLSFVEVDADIFVATRQYVYWFRDLFQGGAQAAYYNSATRPIENLYSRYPNNGACYHLPDNSAGETDIIIVQSSLNDSDRWADYDNNEGGYFIYNRKYKGWSVWISSFVNSPFFYDSTIPLVFGCNNLDGIQMIVSGSMIDQAADGTTYNIETSWKTPYIEPFNGQLQSLLGLRVFYRSTYDGSINKVRAIADYSDYNSSFGFYTQSSTTQVNPGVYADQQVVAPTNTSNHYNTFASIGLDGGCLSFQVTQRLPNGADHAHVQDVLGAVASVQDGGIIF